MRYGFGFVVAAALGAVAYFQAPSASAPGAETYDVDPVHSVVLFRITHLNVSAFHGRFNDVSGTFTVDDAGKGSVDITVKAGSVDTGNEKRDDHLRSPDFFNAEQFPAITFQSKELRKLDGKKYEAKGTLALHGESKEITVPLERIGSGAGMEDWRTGFEAVFTIRRSDFGITYGEGVLGDDVRMTVAIEGIRK
jgi:polyisoprenoid-binding protein YceI